MRSDFPDSQLCAEESDGWIDQIKHDTWGLFVARNGLRHRTLVNECCGTQRARGGRDLRELLNDWTIGNVTGLESFCCTDEPAPMERLELPLSICGEGCVDAFIGSAVNAPLGELQARGQLIGETMEAIRRATN